MAQAKQIAVYFDGLGKVTEKAVQIFIDGESFWVAKSIGDFQKKNLGNGHVAYKVIVPLWVANRNGWLSQNWDGTNKFVFDVIE